MLTVPAAGVAGGGSGSGSGSASALQSGRQSVLMIQAPVSSSCTGGQPCSCSQSRASPPVWSALFMAS